MSVSRDDLFAKLDSLGISHETAEHAAVFTVEEGAAIKAQLPGGHTKNLFLKDIPGPLPWPSCSILCPPDIKFGCANRAQSARIKTDDAGVDSVTYMHDDHLGSASLATGNDGAVLWRESYTPFGETMLSPAANDNQGGFTGHIKDKATGLNYMQARYYDPNMGRFLSIDPVTFMDTGEPGMFNRYAYTFNDPVNQTDPTGKCPPSACGFAPAGHSSIASQPTKNLVNKGQGVAGVVLATLVIPGPEDVVLAGAALTKTGQAIKGALGAKKLAKTCCFVAGTLVETEDGLRPIEEIELGDRVLARNPETGETALKLVTDLIRLNERQIWEVSLSGENNASEFFETTDDHPWWIVDADGNGSWKTTTELSDGMIVTTADNQTMVIVKVAQTDRIDATYNLTIADFETYFVGENKVLVHNCPTGSYTNTHASGKTYDGKGDPSRAAESGRRVGKANNDPVVSTETRTASSDRESFKQESRSLDANGGPKSDNNYNKIESPGKKYREEDGF